MDGPYESDLSLSQRLNVCVGLHTAYLRTTQVPQARLNLSAALYLCLNTSLGDRGHKFKNSREPVLEATHAVKLLIILQRLFTQMIPRRIMTLLLPE